MISKINRIQGVKFSPNGKMCASSAADGSIRIWDLVTGRSLHCFDSEAFSSVGSTGPTPSFLAFHPRNSMLSSVFDGIVKLFDLRDWKLKGETPIHPGGRVGRVSFIDKVDGSTPEIISAYGGGLRIWNCSDQKLINEGGTQLMTPYDSLEMRWGGEVGDMVIDDRDDAEKKVTVASISNDFITIWSTKLNECKKSDDEENLADDTIFLRRSAKDKKSQSNDSDGIEAEKVMDENIMRLVLLRSSFQAKDLSLRLRTLRQLKAQWQKGDVLSCIAWCRRAVDFPQNNEGDLQRSQNTDVVTSPDASAVQLVCHFLRLTDFKTSRSMTLDIAAALLPVLSRILFHCDGQPSQHQLSSVLETAIDFVDAFGAFVLDVVRVGGERLSVDLAGDHRREKGLTCMEEMVS